MIDFRPFTLLKLIRDNKINLREIERLANMGTRENYRYRRFIDGLRSLEFVSISDSGDIVPTNKLSLLLNALDLSLTQLENLSEESMVYSPGFGLPSREFEKTDIFMVMPFLEKLKPVFEDHVRIVAEKLQLSIARGDDFFTSRSIISDIWNAINSCKIVIADCTGRNPNVFYEIGIAHTIGRPVILISQNKEDIPFDLQHIRYIIYEYTPRGMSEFERILVSTVKGELMLLRSGFVPKIRLE